MLLPVSRENINQRTNCTALRNSFSLYDREVNGTLTIALLCQSKVTWVITETGGALPGAQAG
jgi:hypothetical protein